MLPEKLLKSDEENLEAIDESDFEYELDQSRFVSFEEVHQMVRDSTAGHNLVETRPTLFLYAMGQMPGTTHLSCNDLVTYWTNEAKPAHEVQALLE